ncbi:MAG: T9SS type A sorting domain-containing protein [Bacteroidetes bacterium]|nr:T9SS type A sorting domain-containing protein [Bacteroidota bacterium]
MKKIITIIITVHCSLFTVHSSAQDPQWINYTNGDYIKTLAVDGNMIWVGTNGGLVAHNKITGVQEFYNRANSGLPTNNITAIAIEENGTTWIGTDDCGLAVFDGDSWTVYNTSNSGLSDNNVRSIAIDDNGTKWIGTYGGGLAAFNGTNWTVYNTSNSGLPDDWITSIAIDDNGTKWMGTQIYGIVAFDDNNWDVYNTSNSGLLDDYVNAIAIDENETLWIGTGGCLGAGGLASFDGSNWIVYNTSNSGLFYNDICSIAIDESGTKWIGTFEVNILAIGGIFGHGLTSFDGINWTTYDASNSGLPENFVSSVTPDENGILWVGTRDGLATFDGNNWTLINSSNSGLPDNRVSCIAIEANETKWIGTYSTNMWPWYRFSFTSFDGSYWTVYDPDNSELPYDIVNSIAIDQNGTKWIGTGGGYLCEGGGLASFDGNNWNSYDTSNSPLPSNYISSIAVGINGTKWVGTDIGGLAAYDGTNWTVYNTSNSGLPDNSITSLAVEENGIIWIGTATYNGACLTTFDGTNWTVLDTVSGVHITTMVFDGNGKLWIGTHGDGLLTFENGNLVVYNTSNSGLPDNGITSLAIEDNEVVWIGTDSGLSAFDGINWNTYNTSNSGLAHNHINSIVTDQNGSKWIGTYNGLAVFNENGIPFGIDEPSVGIWQSAVSIYPNPASNIVSLVSQPGIEVISLEILDIQGKVVMHQLIMKNEQSYNISHLPKGLYFIRIHTSKGIEVKKLVIQ